MSRPPYFILCILLCASCDFLNRKKEVAGVNLFADEVVQTIYQHQDQRQTDSLLPYLTHESATYRALAAQAFASVQDSNACAALWPLLEDKDSLVVRASAYALGQTACKQALHPLMAQASNASLDQETRFYILEAIGKCANDTALAFLSNYPIKNCPEGVAAGLLRASIKNVTSAKGLAIATTLLENDFSEKARVFASTYLARLRDQDLSPIAERLIHGLRNDISPFVRMNCAMALGYTKSAQGVEALKDAVMHDESVLVQVNALRGLQRQKNEIGFEVAFEALQHLNGQVAYTAAQLVTAQLSKKNTERVLVALEKIKNWRVRATLTEGLIGMNPEKYSAKALEQLRKSGSAYEQAALINALASHPENYGFIKERLYISEGYVVRTAAIDALIKIRNHQRFGELEKLQPKIAQEFAAIFKKAIESKDIGQAYAVAIELRNPERNYRQWFDNIDFLRVTRDAMELPKDIEGYQELQKTIDFFEGKTTETTIEKSAAHPIDWALVKSIPQRQLIQISTSKGDITMELYVNEAPGTVATIVSLVNSGFYNGKKFHRVVPNFVAQGGCPRGDGFGGLSYTIRSEFAPLYYEQGSVGVASAGKDTESCQWFITHSPTPHLDGRYTIFAKVTKGMEVVQQLQVGDLIEHASLVN